MNTYYNSPNIFCSQAVANVSQLGKILFAETISANALHFKAIEDHKFDDSRNPAIDGLIPNHVFQIEDCMEIPNGTRIYGTQFV